MPRQGVEDLLRGGRNGLIESERSRTLRLPLVDSDTKQYRKARQADHEHVDLETTVSLVPWRMMYDLPCETIEVSKCSSPEA